MHFATYDASTRSSFMLNVCVCVCVCVCVSVLSRVLEPTVMMEMSLSDGSVHNFEVSCFHDAVTAVSQPLKAICFWAVRQCVI